MAARQRSASLARTTTHNGGTSFHWTYCNSSNIVLAWGSPMMIASLCIAYYCSGHGYGHATRVSAFARHLRSLDPPPTIHIVSSAPRHVFNDCIDVGTVYRNADIDPVVIQPVAYRVDRRKSFDALKSFLSKKEILVRQEKQWLIDIGADCVLSDAAFLGCLAAHAARLPSVLVTNFTFDSVYSYLSTLYKDHNDEPISNEEIFPLVRQIYEGYRCADLLVRLPGFIPIPSFSAFPSLPSPSWTDQETNKLLPEILQHLNTPLSQLELNDAVPFCQTADNAGRPRYVMEAPLLVRAITTSPESVHTPGGRSRFLSCIGVPEHLHDPQKTKVLVVSFGGQVFRKPSSSLSSRNSTADSTPGSRTPPNSSTDHATSSCGESDANGAPISSSQCSSGRLTTPSHLYIPGAPPATKPDVNRQGPACTLMGADSFSKNGVAYAYFDALITASPLQEASDLDPKLLPDSSWIAIVCGVSRQQWGEGRPDDELPKNFFIAPNYVYMPDLTAIADVLLGKLVRSSFHGHQYVPHVLSRSQGYGTVSECVDSCTPFVYVPRPLFVEEHGLKEIGEWACAVEEAWFLGRDAKMKMREKGMLGMGVRVREKEGRALATDVTDWVRAWHDRLV
ncbi:hypothetical protein F5I97DRAFT_1889167 [Phlebopus sp. FC_14]|nr:hypothetical protein F5I97DRAFT_1889167 [Phlebopus sp. FC_14]